MTISRFLDVLVQEKSLFLDEHIIFMIHLFPRQLGSHITILIN
jgi:hypothetical protein